MEDKNQGGPYSPVPVHHPHPHNCDPDTGEGGRAGNYKWQLRHLSADGTPDNCLWGCLLSGAELHWCQLHSICVVHSREGVGGRGRQCLWFTVSCHLPSPIPLKHKRERESSSGQPHKCWDGPQCWSTKQRGRDYAAPSWPLVEFACWPSLPHRHSTALMFLWSTNDIGKLQPKG